MLNMPPVSRNEQIAQQSYQPEPEWTSLFPGSVFSQGSPDYKLIALTFDDAPDSLFAPVLLDILSHYNVKATFFCLGRCVHENPDVLKRIAREGHVIGNHTYDHADLSKITPDQTREQVARTEDEINRVVGLRTVLFRPPYGFLNMENARVVLSMGYKIILWNVDSYDWMGLTGPAIAARVVAGTTPGSIILMHNTCGGHTQAGAGTIQSLPYVIEILKAEGYAFTTVSGLLNMPPYQ